MLPIEELIDRHTLGDVISPGRVTFSGHDRDQNWDVQKAKGEKGASSTLNGQDLGEFQATYELFDETDYDRWEEFQKLIESTTNGSKPVALPIYHPDLARNRFTEVVNRGIGGMLHDGKGGATVIVKYGEHSPPKPKPVARAVAKPAQTMATTDEGGRSPPKEDPNAAAKRELAALRTQAQEP